MHYIHLVTQKNVKQKYPSTKKLKMYDADIPSSSTTIFKKKCFHRLREDLFIKNMY